MTKIVRLYVLIVLILSSQIASAFTYTEVTTDGWGQSMSRSAPAITDIDGDGLYDLLIGESEGNINQYEQDSLNSHRFNLVTTNFNSIDVGSQAAPAVADIDNDGLIDLLIGEADGNINHYEQDSPNSTTFNLVTSSFSSIDVGTSAVPTVKDLDGGDGLYDLLIGESAGNINHYSQDSTDSTSFSLVTDTFNSIDVGTSSAPAIRDIDGNARLDLLIGNGAGNISHYEQDSTSSRSFTLITANFNSIDVGYNAVPAMRDLDNDSLIDLLIGGNAGSINYYSQNSTTTTDFTLVTTSLNIEDFSRLEDLPWVISTDFDDDNLVDILIGSNNNATPNIHHFEQTSLGSSDFTRITTDFSSLNIFSSGAAATDLDGDNLIDLLVVESSNIDRYEQSASHSTTFSLITNDIATAEDNAMITTTDIDGNGLIDILTEDISGMLSRYEQDTEDEPGFALVTNTFLSSGGKSFATDVDNDGLLDILVGEPLDGSITRFEQDSSHSTSFTLVTYNFGSINIGSSYTILSIAAPDINNDGLVDIIVTNSDTGAVHLFLSNSECGDSITSGSEECDDGNADDSDSCTSSCISQNYYCQDTDLDGEGDTGSCQYLTPDNASVLDGSYVANSTDCDDTNASINTSVEEVCSDSIDNDCDSETDELETEVCDAIDNDCDSQIDEGVQNTYYADTDGDGDGDLDNIIMDCVLPSSASTNSLDCNDSDATINVSATEICENDIDENCDNLDAACSSSEEPSETDPPTTENDDGDNTGSDSGNNAGDSGNDAGDSQGGTENGIRLGGGCSLHL